MLLQWDNPDERHLIQLKTTTSGKLTTARVTTHSTRLPRCVFCICLLTKKHLNIGKENGLSWVGGINLGHPHYWKLFSNCVHYTTMYEFAQSGERHQNKKNFSIRALPELPKPHPQFGQLYRLFPADKNDVLRVWRKKILMMIIIAAMIILIKILVILMIMMTKNTEKPTNIVNFG